jgi:hypothetical protein
VRAFGDVPLRADGATADSGDPGIAGLKPTIDTLLIAGRESSTVSFVACSVSVCFSASVGLIEPVCFPVPVFGGLGGNELN